jgi:hypothetical protein
LNDVLTDYNVHSTGNTLHPTFWYFNGRRDGENQPPLPARTIGGRWQQKSGGSDFLWRLENGRKVTAKISPKRVYLSVFLVFEVRVTVLCFPNDLRHGKKSSERGEVYRKIWWKSTFNFTTKLSFAFSQNKLRSLSFTGNQMLKVLMPPKSSFAMPLFVSTHKNLCVAC